jgi:hypothetical protein
MVRADVIYLVKRIPENGGVFDDYEETRRMVYCTIHSVGMREAYEAMGHGLNPEVVFELSDYAEYLGEKIVVWQGVRYDVIRTYVKGQKIEITVQRSDRNA